jgi:hypothetical protein
MSVQDPGSAVTAGRVASVLRRFALPTARASHPCRGAQLERSRALWPGTSLP